MKNEKPHQSHGMLQRFFILILLIILTSCGGGGGSSDSGSSSYSVSGTISATSAIAFDSDTNDPDAEYSSNNTTDTAQVLAVPVTVGGYVNQPASGSTGRSYNSGDISDFYLVTLAAEQVISLEFSTASRADLDLFVYYSNGELYDSSEGLFSSTETIQVTDAGDYYIEVLAYSGAANYQLSIGQSVYNPGAEELHLSDDFVPGELIVNYATGINLASAVSSPAKLGLETKAGAAGRPMRLSFNSSSDRGQIFEQLGATRKAASIASSVSDTPVQKRLDTLALVKVLGQRSDIASADLNYRRYHSAIPNDPAYSDYQAWNYELIGIPEAWDTTTGSDDVIVAVIDTGALLDHPDLDGRLISGYDFISDSSSSNDGDGIDSDPSDPGDSTVAGESSFHGTQVSGIIGATTNNATGVSGITWSGKIMPLRTLGIDGGTSYDIIQAVRYAAGLSNDSGTLPDTPADIINLSLGGTGYSESEQDLYTQLQNSGIIVIASAGNYGSSIQSYPAAYDGVFSVSAVDADGNLASYSSYGSSIDVAAPGGDDLDYVYSTNGDDSKGSIEPDYAGMQGTSVSAPHVTGVAALIKALRPELTSNDFDSLLRNGLITTDLGNSGRDDDYGYGLIDAASAVAWAAGTETLPTTLISDPGSLLFGISGTSSTIEVSASGTDDVGTISVSSSEDWLSISATSIDSDGLGTYRATVDRTDLASGSYSATLTFASSQSDIAAVTVNVSMLVATTDTSIDGGYHHIYLLDPASEEVAYETGGAFANGEISYNFPSVASGTYLIYAGTDFDNDDSMSDEGESIGAYLSTSQLQTVRVTEDVEDLDFSVQFSEIWHRWEE